MSLPVRLICLLLCLSPLQHLFASELDSLLRVARQQDGEELAATSGLLSKTYLRTQTDSALYYAQQQSRLAGETGNRQMQMFGHIHQGFAFKYLGEYPSSLEHHIEALAIARELDDRLSESQYLNAIATLFQRMKDYEQSQSYFQQAIAIKRSLGDSLAVANSYINYGNLLDKIDDEEGALDYYRRALALYEAENDTAGLVLAVGNLGAQLLNMRRLEEAEVIIRQGMEISLAIDDQISYLNGLINLGIIKELQEEYLVAEDLYRQSFLLAGEIPLPEELQKLQHSRARAFSGAGNHERAYHFEREAYFISDSVFQLSKAEALAELQAEFEVAEKDLAISQLEEANAKESLENTRLWGGVIGLVLAVLVIVLSFFIYQYRRERLQEARLRAMEQQQFRAVITGEENERKRIAGDLHDSLGQLLSATKLQLSSIEEDNSSLNQQHLSTAIHMLDESVKEVRQISHNLAPPALTRGGLVLAVKDLAAMIRNTTGISCEAELPETPVSLSKATEVHAFRILQELVNNGIRHAECQHISLRLSQEGEAVSLRYQDDGKGFDYAKVEQAPGGLGWQSIRGRLKIIRGDLSIQSDQINGTRVKILIPAS